MRDAAHGLVRALAIGLGAFELAAGIAFLMIVVVIGGAVESPDPVGGAIVWAIALLALAIPTFAILAALFASSARSSAVALLAMVILLISVVSVYLHYA